MTERLTFSLSLSWLYVLRCPSSLGRVRLFATPWTTARQAPLSMGILQARILEWVACPPLGDLPNTEIKSRSPTLQADSLPSEPQGSPHDSVCAIYCLYLTSTTFKNCRRQLTKQKFQLTILAQKYMRSAFM